MKYIFSFIIFFSSTIVFSQNKNVTVPKIDITFLDGTVKQGFGYVKKDSKIVYRHKIDNKKTFYDYTTVAKVTTKYNTIVRHLEYKTIIDGSKEKIMLLETGIEGKVKMYYNYKAPLFKMNKNGYLYIPSNNLGFGAPMPMAIKSYGGTNDDGPGRIKYYLAKQDSKFVERIKNTSNIYHKKFRKVYEKYFSDCEKLKIKYEGKDFHKEDFEALINFYNNRCKSENILKIKGS